VTHQDDLRLASACVQGDPAALRSLEEVHLSRIDRYIAHLRRPAAFADEVRQRLRERILVGRAPKLLHYSGRGPLAAWIRIAAVRQALDLIDQEKEPGDALEEDQFAAAVDPEAIAIRDRHLPQFRQAFRAALASLSARERNLLRLYLIDGLNIGRIGELFGKSRASIGRMVIECREKLLHETRLQLGALTGASAGDVRSLIRVLQSQLDVSIRGFLQRAELP
jgi:RNA polymerase sigma-70 factor, ECF subfamily